MIRQLDWQKHIGTRTFRPANELLSLRNARGLQMRLIAGKLLVTAYDRIDDFVLRPGESFMIANNRVVLAEAIEDCSVDLETRAPSRSLPIRLLENCFWRLRGVGPGRLDNLFSSFRMKVEP